MLSNTFKFHSDNREQACNNSKLRQHIWKPATTTQDSSKAIDMTPWGMLWQLKTIMCNNSIFHSCNNWGQRLLKHVHNFERFFPKQSECYHGNTHFQQLQPQQVTSPGMISSSLISHTSWQQWFDHSWKYPHVWKVSCFFRWQLITLQSRDSLDSSQNKLEQSPISFFKLWNEWKSHSNL